MANPRILIADDKEFLRKSFRRLIRSVSKEIEVDEAANADELLRKTREATARNQPYSLIFTDQMMGPGKRGLEAIEELRTYDSNTPSYLCTAEELADFEDVIRRSGATGYIDKANAIVAIEAAIKKHLGLPK